MKYIFKSFQKNKLFALIFEIFRIIAESNGEMKIKIERHEDEKLYHASIQFDGRNISGKIPEIDWG